MKNFRYWIPTEVFFGRGQIEVLPREIKKYGKKIMLVYGGGSIKKIGLYHNIIEEFNKNNIDYCELGGVDPNPKLESVIKGRDLAKKENVDFILAVGGGSTIDCAKAIAAAYYYPGNPWDLVLDSKKIKKALPLATVLTLAATGSEMNGSAVITNPESKEKYGMTNDRLKPKFSIMDPSYTFTVSKKQTASGVADIYSHTIENYFSNEKGAFLVDRLAESVLKTCIKYGPIAIENGEDYEARANLMWASSLAINGILNYGKSTIWSVHTIEHELTASCDELPHGIGLAILTTNWMEEALTEENIWKYVEYGVNVFNIDSKLPEKDIARMSIEKTEEFFRSLGINKSLRDFGIRKEEFPGMAERAIDYRGGKVGSFKPLSYENIVNILEKSY